MTFLIVRKLFGTKDQEFFGMAKGTEIRSSSIQRPHKGERKTLLVAFGTKMGIGVIQRKALRRRLLLTLRLCLLLPTLAGLWRSLTQYPSK